MKLTKSEVQIGIAAFAAVAVLAVIAQLVYAPLAVPVGVGAASAVLAVIALRFKNHVAARIEDRASALEATLRQTRSEVEETRALVALQEPTFDLPLPWTGWAVPPRGLLEVLKSVQQFDAPNVIDCGSGVSTLHLARAVRQMGRGRVVALEQDAAWADYVRRMLERNDLQAWATIVVAPLEKSVVCDRATLWYALPDDVLPRGDRVDMLVVDGPTGKDGILTRLGALPYFWDRLSEKAVVFLDDTTRPEEQEIARLWRERYAVDETAISTEHGMSKFTRKSA